MSAAVVIGLDVGSGSTKAVAFTATGAVLAHASVAYQPYRPAPEVAEYDARALRGAAVEALSRLARNIDGAQVAAIGVDAMESGVVPLDAAGEPVAAYTTTLDTRFAPDLDDYVSHLGDRARHLCGSDQATMAPKIAWLRRTRPELSEHTATYALAGSLVGGYLAGGDASAHYVDPTYLWTTGLADVAAGTWSGELCRATGIDPAWLPRIVAPTDVIGRLSPAVARRCGIRSGVPIVASCGDQSAGYAGAGIDRPGVVGDSTGTYACLAVAHPRYAPGTQPAAPIAVPAAQPGLCHYVHIVIGGGLTRQWADDLLAGGDLAALEEAAAAVAPGCDGLTMLPYLGGTAAPPNAHARGSFVGLNWSHKAPQLYRAVLESVALDHAASLRFMPPGTTVDELVGFGGGSRSTLWNQIKSDVFGVPIRVLDDFPVTELGSALLGAQGVGLIDDVAAVADAARPIHQTLTPDPARHERYRELTDEFAALARALAEPIHGKENPS